MSDDVFEIIKNGGLLVSGGVVTAIIAFARSYWVAKNQRTEITPTMFDVKAVEPSRTVNECIRLMNQNDASHARMFAMIETLIATSAKLEERMKDISEIKDDIRAIARRAK